MSTKVGKGIFRLARITLIGLILIVITLIGSCVLLVLRSESTKEPPSPPPPAPAYEAYTGDNLGSFTGVHSVPTDWATRSASIAQFGWQDSSLSVIAEGMRGIDSSIRRIVIAGEHRYGVDAHDFGRIVGNEGRFEKITPPPELPEMSWTAGLTTDSDQVFILRSHVYSHIYVFDPTTRDWRLLRESRGPLRGLAVDAQSSELFSLQPQQQEHGEELTALAVFNEHGALLRTVPLSPRIAHPELQHNDWRDRLQLFALDERLLALIPGAWDRDSATAAPLVAYAIDQRTGKVETIDIRD